MPAFLRCLPTSSRAVKSSRWCLQLRRLGCAYSRQSTSLAARAVQPSTPASGDQPHQPVLLSAVLDTFNSNKLVTFVDGTVGAGGHSAALLAAHPEIDHLLGLDADPTALQLAATRLSAIPGQPARQLSLIQKNFVSLAKVLEDHSVRTADGVLFDIGVSSMQLDTPERGFSFSKPGPLDMRMGPSARASAADLVNTLPEQDLAEIFRDYGEERMWRRLARNVCEARNSAALQTTDQLIAALRLPPRPRAGKGKGQKAIHPATRVFQALRIAVNDELGVLEAVIPQAIQSLSPGGRLAIITFHSLEDRLVKLAFRTAAGLVPPEEDARLGMHLTDAELQKARPQPAVALVNRKPITASPEEAEANPRSRSAKLRVVQKL